MKRVKLLPAIVFIFIFNACFLSTQPTSDISAFTEVAGLKYGDKLNKVYALFGKPDTIIKTDESDDFEEIIYKYNRKVVLKVLYHKRTNLVRNISIKNRKAHSTNNSSTSNFPFFDSRHIIDEKLNILGADVNNVFDAYGHGYFPFFFKYEYWDSRNKTSVVFETYKKEDKKNILKSIMVTWRHSYSK